MEVHTSLHDVANCTVWQIERNEGRGRQRIFDENKEWI